MFDLKPKLRYTQTNTNFEMLNEIYLNQILKFCGLYLTEEGFIKSYESNEPLRSATENKVFIVVDNYQKYTYFLTNKDMFIAFNPYINERHLFILMRWVQNAIFQTDAEFNEFFLESFNSQNVQNLILERSVSDEEIFNEASKHITLTSLSPDFRNCIRRQWVIETNLRNQLINKVISEVYLPSSVPSNIGILISLKEVADYYLLYGETFYQKDHLQEAENIAAFLNQINIDMRKNKDKYIKNTVENKKSKEYDLDLGLFDKESDLTNILNNNKFEEKQYDI